MSRRATIVAALAGVVATALAGCARSPSVRFYALRPIAVAPEPPATAGLAVGVGPVRVPRYLDRPEIVRRRGPDELSYDEFRRWSGNLESEILRTLGENLAVLLESDRIVVYPDEPPFPVAYRVQVSVLAFEEAAEGEVTFRTRWIVTTGNDHSVAVVRRSSLTGRAESARYEDLVAAHSTLLGALAGEIAAVLADLGASDAPRPP